MKNFLKEILNLMKLFPLSSYVVMVVCFEILLHVMGSNFDGDAIDRLIFFSVVFFGYPISFFGNLFDREVSDTMFIWLIIFLAFLLDLLLLSLRTGSLKNFLKKTYHKLTKFTKPKK